MTALVFGALFLAGAFLALHAIIDTVRRYGRTALALRHELSRCETSRTVHVRISEVTVTREPLVLRPDFRRRLPVPAPVPAIAHGLSAAA